VFTVFFIIDSEADRIAGPMDLPLSCEQSTRTCSAEQGRDDHSVPESCAEREFSFNFGVEYTVFVWQL
jgi:hypothetical protein